MLRRRRRVAYIVLISCLLITLIISLLNRLSQLWLISGNSEMIPSSVRMIRSNLSHSLNYNVHIFYYPWYGNPEYDSGSYYHWNHEYLPHWDKEKAQKDIFAGKRHKPPEDVASDFYPLLSAYSSRDPTVIRKHMKWISDCGVGVLVVSWYPPNLADDHGVSWDDLMPQIMNTAYLFNLKIAFHLEPYKQRTAQSVREDIRYIIGKYSNHPAFYYYSQKDSSVKKPFFYVYDSYLIPYSDWASVLKSPNNESALDVYLLGLLVKSEDETGLVNGGFDGFYTYFGSDSFSYGSTQSKWKDLTDYGRSKSMISSISVAPGYTDVRVRRWNAANTKARQGGQYYKNSWHMAVRSKPDIISITSFNEWHEGTQIEPSVPKAISTFTYLDYSPNTPDFYLQLTKSLTLDFT